jgi:hypothetical protein
MVSSDTFRDYRDRRIIHFNVNDKGTVPLLLTPYLLRDRDTCSKRSVPWLAFPHFNFQGYHKEIS